MKDEGVYHDILLNCDVLPDEMLLVHQNITNAKDLVLQKVCQPFRAIVPAVESLYWYWLSNSNVRLHILGRLLLL
jgi:hypothetical protein